MSTVVVGVGDEILVASDVSFVAVVVVVDIIDVSQLLANI